MDMGIASDVLTDWGACLRVGVPRMGNMMRNGVENRAVTGAGAHRAAKRAIREQRRHASRPEPKPVANLPTNVSADSVLWFGVFRGVKIKNAPPSYLRWLAENLYPNGKEMTDLFSFLVGYLYKV